MLQDHQYQEVPFQPSELNHKYGSNIHLSADLYLSTLLAKLCDPKTTQPMITYLMEILYRSLLQNAVNLAFPRKKAPLQTRMQAAHPEGNFLAQIIDPETSVVTVDLLRAGILPSQICYHVLNHLINPSCVRQDHVVASRKVNEKQEVIGVDISGAKIGGSVEGSILIFPDPMGATGSTLKHTLQHYQQNGLGQPKKILALHLIVTPEYLKNIQESFPQVEVFALRLDRGLSSAKVLQSIPGTFWNEEKGLNDHQYIIPGAGGLGELMNNTIK